MTLRFKALSTNLNPAPRQTPSEIFTLANHTTEEMIIEACVETLAEALYAEQLGAQQIELCSRLDLDGLTPSKTDFLAIQEKTDLRIKVMIRSRAGDFVYTESEIEQMKEEIRWFEANGVDEIVLGVLNQQNEIDLTALHSLATVAPTLPITFHKAIDLVRDPFLAVEQLCAIPNVDFILSSGQQPTAWEGRELLKKMQLLAGERLSIIVAGKVTPDNLHELAAATNASYFHGRRIV